MSLFTSTREKHLWMWVLLITAGIYATLFVGQPLLNFFNSQKLQAGIFISGMILVAVMIFIHAWQVKWRKLTILLALGMTAVYLMLFLRLGLSERTHLFEYSVLAIFIHLALIERAKHLRNLRYPLLIAFFLSNIMGILDECLQIPLPNRRFDPVDIFFNGFVILVALGSHAVLQWIEKRFRSPRNTSG